MASAPHRLPTEEPDGDTGPGRMGFLEHLDELRTRLIRSCLAIGAGMAVAFLFSERLGTLLLGPTLAQLPAGTAFIYIRPGEGFSFYLDVAFIGGLVLAAPVVAYQVWRFIAPGLYAREKRFAVPFVLLATMGAVGGALFSHFVLFPAAMAFFGTFSSPLMTFAPRLEETFALYKQLLIGMIVAFQIPTVVFFLAKMRLVTARFLWRHFKYAVLIIFIAAAVLTSSPDPWNQTVFAAPMIGLYLLGIVIAWLVGPKEGKESTDAKLRLVIGAMVIDRLAPSASDWPFASRRSPRCPGRPARRC
jgi:sec-independent protein translocase protein TatC